jgi:phosphoribosylformylglycinamidine synthase
MKKARVVVTIKKDVLDPAGGALKNALARQGIKNVAEVRIGKVIDIVFDSESSQNNHSYLELAAKSLLSNPVMEDFSIEVMDEHHADP